ncbi:MAG: GAF domain-containing protein [Chloroflexi bacterium]|nr:GAF domain-containing protein [Chloroflexota bacterium]
MAEMKEQTVWVVDPDPVFRANVEGALRQTGLQVTGLGEATQLWGERDALIITADLLPVQKPAATVIALVSPGDGAAQVKALESGARWFIPRDSAWLSHLPAILMASQAHTDYRLPAALEDTLPRAEIRRQTEEMVARNGSAAHIGQSLDLQDVLGAAVDEVTHVLGVEASFASLVNEEAGELVLCAQRGLCFSHLGMCTPLERGFSGHVVDTGNMVISDVGKAPGLAVSDFAREQVQAMALVPMHSRGLVVGILGAMSRSPYQFTAREIALLRTIGNQVGTAVENAQLYQAVKQHAANLEESHARFLEVDKIRDEFIQNVTHELRMPLTYLRGYVDLLTDGALGPLTGAQLKSLDVVARKTDQVIRLVEDITDMEAVNSETLDIKPMDLGQLARMALAGCRFTAVEAGIEMREEIPKDLPLALADGVRISQVFDNLLGNAIKFSPDGGTITVRIKEEGNWLRAEVSDTGIGIPAEKMPRIFDRFYQGDGSTKRRFGGMGLGLVIVKLIIEAHGGRVGGESKVEEGSTFYFALRKATQ